MNEFRKFHNQLMHSILYTVDTEKLLLQATNYIKGNKVFIVGNGGSAAIASHVAEDFTRLCDIPMITLHDPALMSCFANDFGWGRWVAQAVKQLGAKFCDIGIFISSSGESDNIIEGCKVARKLGIDTITFTGFSVNNRLSKLGDVNFYVSSNNYNIVELTHEFWLLNICELLRNDK